MTVINHHQSFHHYSPYLNHNKWAPIITKLPMTHQAPARVPRHHTGPGRHLRSTGTGTARSSRAPDVLPQRHTVASRGLPHTVACLGGTAHLC